MGGWGYKNNTFFFFSCSVLKVLGFSNSLSSIFDGTSNLTVSLGENSFLGGMFLPGVKVLKGR